MATGKKKVGAKKKGRPAPRKRKRATASSEATTVENPIFAADTGRYNPAWEIFRTYDRDGSGQIDRGELARVLEALGAEPAEAVRAGSLQGAKISWPEFDAWWSSR